MSGAALILTYHAIEQGPPPLCVEPGLLAQHLDCIVESGARVLTVGEIAAGLRAGTLPERAVGITFDDGAASVVDVAAPLLAERGLVATVFCVAGRLGDRSDWPSPRRRLPLAGAAELQLLADSGWEIGSHGVTHEALDGFEPTRLRTELAESKRALEAAVGSRVRSFAYPYGVVPAGADVALRDAGYEAACTTRVGAVPRGANPLSLPRVDAHYLRRPRLLRRALAGRLGAYLAARRVGAGGRRLLRRDEARGRRP